MAHHVVIGAGPVGTGVATALAERGDRVTVVTRSGSGPTLPGISREGADASDATALTALADNARTIYNCANPTYHRWASDWPPIHHTLLATAERTGAVLVMMDNLYALGSSTAMPMRENSPMKATGTKGKVRAMMAQELLDAHAAGRVRATLARASDFFGPGVRDAALGERVVPKVIAGKSVSVLGSLDVPHSSSYMPDVVRTLVAIGDDERAWGKPWQVPNAPATTQRQMIESFARAAGTTAKAKTVPLIGLRALGLVVPMMRELQETWYQFAEPFVTDSSHTEATFSLAATQTDAAAEATIAWWRNQS
jgi:nucleoside-diphosphate-sugar epimerase